MLTLDRRAGGLPPAYVIACFRRPRAARLARPDEPAGGGHSGSRRADGPRAGPALRVISILPASVPRHLRAFGAMGRAGPPRRRPRSSASAWRPRRCRAAPSRPWSRWAVAFATSAGADLTRLGPAGPGPVPVPGRDRGPHRPRSLPGPGGARPPPSPSAFEKRETDDQTRRKRQRRLHHRRHPLRVDGALDPPPSTASTG